MAQIIPLLVVIMCVATTLRIVSFTSTHHRIKPAYSILAMAFSAFLLVNAVLILLSKQGVTAFDFGLMAVVMVLVFQAKGNMSKLFRPMIIKSEGESKK